MSQTGAHATRTPLSALERVAVIGLAGLGFIYLFQFVFVWLVRGGLLLPVMLLSLAAFTLASLIWVRVAWAPVVGAALALVGLAIGFAIDSATLAYPTAQPGRFITFVVELAFLLTTLSVSVILTLPALRFLRGSDSRPLHDPRCLSPLLHCASWHESHHRGSVTRFDNVLRRDDSSQARRKRRNQWNNQ